MYIQSHERVHASDSPALSRDERFSRSKQQNDAILMKWLPRKKDLVLKIGIGVLRKVLNTFTQVKITWDEDVKIPDGFLGKTNIDEVTVFHVDIDGYIQEVVVRKHTSGKIMFQFLDKYQGKIRINATGTYLLHRAFQTPVITFSSDDHSSFDLYEKAAVSIMDHLVNGKRPDKEKSLLEQLNQLPTFLILESDEFAADPEESKKLKEFKLPYEKTLFSVLIGENVFGVTASILNRSELFFEFIGMSTDLKDACKAGVGIVTIIHDSAVDLTINITDSWISRMTAEKLMRVVIGFIISLQTDDITYIRKSDGKNDRIPVPPAINKDGFNVVRYVVGKKSHPVEWQGGTHASPRQHKRQAHDRTLASGEVVRIPETVVNRTVRSKVDKVYVPVKK